MRAALIVGAGVAAFAAAVGASAQEAEADHARQVFIRLFPTAGRPGVFTTGRLSTSLDTFSNVRENGPCEIKYTYTRPNADDIPESYRGESKEQSVTFADLDGMSDVSVENNRLYYSYVRKTTGTTNRIYYQLSSNSDAQALWDAFQTLHSFCQNRVPDQAAQDVVHDARAKMAALAIDRRDGSQYGWAVDWETRDQADNRALQECGRNGAKCEIVLRFRGGCGAYAADQAKGSTLFGWGTALDRPSAESRAYDEVRKRGGSFVITRVWGCNSLLPADVSGSNKTSEPSAADEHNAEAARHAAEDAERMKALSRAEQERVDKQLHDYQANVARAAAEHQAYEQQLADFRRKEVEHDAAVAKAKAAQEEYERQRAAYEAELASGKYKKK